MPLYTVYYTTRVENCVVVEADSADHAREVWMIEDYHYDDPEIIDEYLITDVHVEEA